VGIPGAWPGWRYELEDVHMCVEAALIEKIGDAGRKLHTGRSRNDQVALDLRLWLRESCASIGGLLDQLLQAFAELAERDGGIVMPSYTHMQRAQPICLGGELMAWHTMFSRDRADLARLGETKDSPLGSGAVAGSSLGLDREMSAGLLGFDHASVSSIDSTASRDEGLDFLYTLSRTAMHLSRWAEQWILYCTTEFGFLKLDDRYTTGSSMMPQKKNPDMLELIRGRCGNVYGSFVSLLTICKGLPLAYNRDLQEDKRHIFAAHDMARDCIEMATRIVATAKFDEQRISAGLERGFLDATVLAEYLVTQGVAFRTSHQVVGSLVRLCESKGQGALSQLSVEEMNGAIAAAGAKDVTIGDDVYSYLGAVRVVERYRSSGNAGRTGYRDALAALKTERGAATRSMDREPERAVAKPAKAGTVEPAPEKLFGDAFAIGIDDLRLVDAYGQVGRTLDDLPYTQEFERIYLAIDGEKAGVGKRDVFHRLHNLRKAGKLPKTGRTTASPARIQPQEESFLEEMVITLVGSLGQRDQLPFTAKFDSLVEAFNQRFGRSLEPHDVWRLVAKLAK